MRFLLHSGGVLLQPPRSENCPCCLSSPGAGRPQDTAPVTVLRTPHFPGQQERHKAAPAWLRSSCPVPHRAAPSAELCLAEQSTAGMRLCPFSIPFFVPTPRQRGRAGRFLSLTPALSSVGKLLNKKMLLKHVPSALSSSRGSDGA